MGHVRIPLEELGFLPENRGGMGLSPHHVHEVAWDCLSNGTKLSRYQEVEVVKLPPDREAAVREASKKKCEASTLMPNFSPTMRYVCLTKTHFVHAQKQLGITSENSSYSARKALVAKMTPAHRRRLWWVEMGVMLFDNAMFVGFVAGMASGLTDDLADDDDDDAGDDEGGEGGDRRKTTRED